jgi:hypothetical protein
VTAFFKPICFGLLATMLLQPVLAQRAGGGGGVGAVDGGGQRIQDGGINYAPQAKVYVVLGVDSFNRTVRLQAADGRSGGVYVGEDIYDISTLKPGDKIRVDFLVPDTNNSGLRAASVWAVQ